MKQPGDVAILPLPSVLGPYPDGRVRRVALAGFDCAEDPNRRAIVELAGVLLHGRELCDNGRGTGIVLDTEPDGQWLQSITRRSRTWVTVTPMVQAAKELTSSEWESRRRARVRRGGHARRWRRTGCAGAAALPVERGRSRDDSDAAGSDARVGQGSSRPATATSVRHGNHEGAHGPTPG